MSGILWPLRIRKLLIIVGVCFTTLSYQVIELYADSIKIGQVMEATGLSSAFVHSLPYAKIPHK